MWFYNQRAGAENLIKEANNDAGLAAYPSARWLLNCNHFQLVMLAYNLNCWLMLFNRGRGSQTGWRLRHTTLATTRLKFSISGRQDLAARLPSGSQLQRSLPGPESVSAPDEPAPEYCRGRERLCPSDCCRSTMLRLRIGFYARLTEENQWLTKWRT